jgi:hypothetical protein
MKKLTLKLTLILLTSPMAFASTHTTQAYLGTPEVTYAQVITSVDPRGNRIHQAILGGHVAFANTLGPANITVHIGGQRYTQPTDSRGNFSFFVYTNNAPEYLVEAWLPANALPHHSELPVVQAPSVESVKLSLPLE